MLTRQAEQVDTIWDSLFPEFVRELPEDLAQLDQVLDNPRLLKQFELHWGRANLNVGRPSIPMATYVRLMTLKHRHGWGYDRLVRQVADSFHLRRFCRISIVAEVPDESTVRKLTRRLGPELVDDLTREVVKLAVKERSFKVRAMRCDSTVQESDIRYPTDCGLASDAVKVLARAAGKLRAAIPGLTRKVRNRSRAAGRRIRELNRSLVRRTGDTKQEVQRLTEEVAELAKASLGQARRLLDEAKQAVSSVGHNSQPGVARAISELERVERQGGGADPQAFCRRQDRRAPGLALRSRRSSYPQGQEVEAESVRVHDPVRRTQRQHPARRSRSPRAAQVSHRQRAR